MKGKGRTQHSALAEWRAMTELLSLFFATGALKDESPASAILVGPPGGGKTEMVMQFADVDNAALNPTVRVLSNTSSTGLRTLAARECPRGLRHVVFPEFQALTMRRSDVWASLEGTLLQLMSEGLGDVYNGPDVFQAGGVRIGVIGAMTSWSWTNLQRDITGTGFASRLLALSWSPSLSDQVSAVARAFQGRGDITKVQLGLPTLPRTVRVTNPVHRAVSEYAQARYPANFPRAYKMFRSLAMARALRRGARDAVLSDWRDVLVYERFWLGAL